MPRYMIHTCPSRKWYVDGYLLPSMLAQGIPSDDIIVYMDNTKAGNLHATMNSFEFYTDHGGGTWHLQDDVVISSRFREMTEKHDHGIRCGHCFYPWDSTLNYTGKVGVDKMWFSFPCIRIPNWLARKCAEWFRQVGRFDPAYEQWVKDGNGDDTIFRGFLMSKYPDMKVVNLLPNLVAHVDYLIGGSVAKQDTSVFPEVAFPEPELIEELKTRLEADGWKPGE